MSEQQPSKLKRIGIDILGFGGIIGALLTGWLPGPGGIPLLIIGLGLLATNHQWAAQLLTKVKTHSGRFSKVIFSDSPLIMWTIDLVGIVLIALAVYLLLHVTHSIVKSAAISLIIVSLVLLARNRHRLQHLTAKILHRQP